MGGCRRPDWVWEGMSLSDCSPYSLAQLSYLKRGGAKPRLTSAFPSKQTSHPSINYFRQPTACDLRPLLCAKGCVSLPITQQGFLVWFGFIFKDEWASGVGTSLAEASE